MEKIQDAIYIYSGAVHVACECGFVEGLTLLVEAGAAVEDINEMQQALIYIYIYIYII